MKTTFVGDIHGKVDAVKAALDKDGDIIFVGDIIDSWNRTRNEHDECYALIIEACANGKARCIYGNHELSYLLPQLHRSSGWNLAREQVVMAHKLLIEEYFEHFVLLENNEGEPLLVTHAGLSDIVYQKIGSTLPLSNLKYLLNEQVQIYSSPVHWIGHSRGGLHYVGGIYWCTFPDEFVPITGLHQVFGHTAHKDIQCVYGPNKETNYMIDCLDYQRNKFLTIDL